MVKILVLTTITLVLQLCDCGDSNATSQGALRSQELMCRARTGLAGRTGSAGEGADLLLLTAPMGGHTPDSASSTCLQDAENTCQRGEDQAARGTQRHGCAPGDAGSVWRHTGLSPPGGAATASHGWRPGCWSTSYSARTPEMPIELGVRAPAGEAADGRMGMGAVLESGSQRGSEDPGPADAFSSPALPPSLSPLSTHVQPTWQTLRVPSASSQGSPYLPQDPRKPTSGLYWKGGHTGTRGGVRLSGSP